MVSAPVDASMPESRLASTMPRHAGLLTTACILMCLAVNYTFPLNRGIKLTTSTFRGNNTLMCFPANHIHKKPKRYKKMESNFEETTSSAQELYHSAMELKKLSDQDLHQYEQLVIMKKYPYLDFKELEFELNPAGKRQSFKEYSGINSDANDPGIYEPADNLNVEIFNRGLSGFTIPRKFVNSLTTLTKLQKNDVKVIPVTDAGIKKLPLHTSLNNLRNLKHYIEAYLHD